MYISSHVAYVLFIPYKDHQSYRSTLYFVCLDLCLGSRSIYVTSM